MNTEWYGKFLLLVLSNQQPFVNLIIGMSQIPGAFVIEYHSYLAACMYSVFVLLKMCYL